MVGCAMQVLRAPSLPSKINLLALNESETAALVREQGWPAYRTGQILRWIYQRRALTIEDMTDLSLADRAALSVRATTGRTAPGCITLNEISHEKQFAGHHRPNEYWRLHAWRTGRRVERHEP